MKKARPGKANGLLRGRKEQAAHGVSGGRGAYGTVVVALFAAAAALFQLIHNVVGIQTPFGMVVDLAGLPVLLAFFLFGFEAALGVCTLLAIIITLVSPETWIGASMKFAATIPMILAPALWLLSSKSRNDIGKAAGIILLSAGIPLSVFALSGFVNLSLPDVGGGVLYQVPSLQAGDSVILNESEVTPSVLLKGIAPIAVIAAASLLIAYVWRRYGEGLKPSRLSDPKSMVIVTLLAILVRGVAMVIANYYFAGPMFFGFSPEKFMALAPWHIIFGWNAVQGVIEMAFAWTIAFKFRFFEYYRS